MHIISKLIKNLSFFILLFIINFSSVPAIETSTEAVSGLRTLAEEKKTEQQLDKKAEEFFQKSQEMAYFGYDFFKQKMSENELSGPVSPNYLICPGDQIVIDVWGDLKLNYLLEVTADGYIDIPEAGRVYVNGLTFSNLKNRIIGQLSLAYSTYINPKNIANSKAIVEVTLGKIKGVRVMCSGEVENPGTYLIQNTQASVFNILRLAGGIIQNKGSLRRIKIIKADGKEIEYDFYDYYIKGKADKNVNSLQSGDIIYVPLKIKEVIIEGEIKKPSIYELKEKETLKDLIEFAGGFTPKAFIEIIHLVRIEPGKGRQYIDIPWKEIIEGKNKDFLPLDADRYTITQVSKQKRENFIEIAGDGIKSPGIYQFYEGMKIFDIVSKAAGLVPDVLLDRADLIRTKENMDIFFSTFSLKNLSAISSPENFNLEPMDKIIVYSKFSLKGGEKSITIKGNVKKPGTYPLSENLKLSNFLFAVGGFEDNDFKKNTYLERGDIIRYDKITAKKNIIPFNLGKLLEGDFSEDQLLQSQDEIIIYPYKMFQDEKKIEIYGSVRKPGTYEYFENMNLSDIIDISGGLSDDAYTLKAEVVRQSLFKNNEVNDKKNIVFVFNPELQKSKEILLLNKDIVYIRKNPDVKNISKVTISGLVKFPGEYVLKSDDERLSSIIDRAGGILPSAFIDGVTFYREKDNIGKIIINLAKIIKNKNTKHDLILVNGDKIDIPEKNYVINVTGAVQLSGNIQYIPGADVDYYIESMGGFKENADRDRIVIIKPNGRSISGHGFLFNSEVPMGSTIVVPEKNNKKKSEW